MARPKGGFLLLLGLGFPPFLVHLGGEGREEGEKERGAGTLPNSVWAWGRAPTLAASSSLPLNPIKAH